jgi:hypothetical protein
MPAPRRCDRRRPRSRGDREGTCGDPFGLRCTSSRRLRAGNDATVAGEPTSCSAAGRPILAWAPGEDGPNLRTTTPKSPVRVASGRTRLHPADWAPGGHQRPEELPWPSRVSLERVSSYDPKAAEPHRRHGGWRHPPPSGSPSGPVGPSGRNSNPDFPVQPRRPLGAKRNLEGGRGHVKAMFPLARRVCPAQDGRTTSMEFPVMSRASGQARLGVHRFAAPPQEPWRAVLRPGPGCAAPSSQPPTPARCCPTGTYSNARPRAGFPAGEPCHRS